MICENCWFCETIEFEISPKKLIQEDSNAKTAYLADKFDFLNNLNLSMQGLGFTVIDYAAKVAAYHRKLNLWKSHSLKMSTICSHN